MKKTISIFTALVLLLITAVPFTGAFAKGTGLGDLDGDGKITASDARAILRGAVGLDKLSAEDKQLADIDGDSKVSASDARIALRIAVKLESVSDYEKSAQETPAKTDDGKKDDTTSDKDPGKETKPQPADATDKSHKTNEYKTLKSGVYSASLKMGRTGEEIIPLVIGKTAKTIYVSAVMDGSMLGDLGDGKMTFTMMKAGNKYYLITESDGEKLYATVDPAAAQGESDMEDLISAMKEMIDMMSDYLPDFSGYPELNEAIEIKDETADGVKCKKYTFADNEGFTDVYMSGNRLVKIRLSDKNDVEQMYLSFDYVSPTVPEEQKSIKPYTESDLMELLFIMMFSAGVDLGNT